MSFVENVPDKNFEGIYIKKENTSNLKVSVFHSDIWDFETGLYDKRDTFSFSIVRMPYRDSYTSTRIFYVAARSEILCHATTTSSKEKLLIYIIYYITYYIYT